MIEGDLIGRRVAAALIDGIVVFLLFLFVGFVTGDAETSDSSASVELEGAETVVWGLFGFAYHFATEARWGRTLRAHGGQGAAAARRHGGRHRGRPRLTRCRLRNSLAQLAV